MKKIIILIGMFVVVLLLTGCVGNDTCQYEEKYTHVVYGRLKEVWTDTTMASLAFYNRSGITFYPSPNEGYDWYVFELLEIGANYTFVFHLEDNVPRPGIDIYYINDAPVIDQINRDIYTDYWINDRGCIEW